MNLKKKTKPETMPCTVAQTCHPRTEEAEAGGLVFVHDFIQRVEMEVLVTKSAGLNSYRPL